eukprot:3284081-Rhodomonas_salina.2
MQVRAFSRVSGMWNDLAVTVRGRVTGCLTAVGVQMGAEQGKKNKNGRTPKEMASDVQTLAAF